MSINKTEELDKIKPYNEKDDKTEQVRRMFNNIAEKYDQLNNILSLGKFHSWRYALIDILATYSPRKVLDIATGTGDLAIDMANKIASIENILGVDISEEMMRIGEYKVQELHLENKISFQKENAVSMSFEDNSFDAITISFGIRNFEDIQKSLHEMYRVLKPGGVLIFLELTEPKNKLLYWGYKIYSSTIFPIMGKVLAKDVEAYKYLSKSIASVPQREEMTELMENAKFENTFYRSLKLETCTIYFGTKAI